MIALVALSGFAIEGRVHSRGAVVEVSEEDARDLLRRGKARVATADDAPGISQAPSPEAPKAEEPTNEAPKESFKRARRRGRNEG